MALTFGGKVAEGMSSQAGQPAPSDDFGDPVGRKKPDWGYTSFKGSGWYNNHVTGEELKHFVVKFLETKSQTYVTVGIWTPTYRCSNGQRQGYPMLAIRWILDRCNSDRHEPEEYEGLVWAGSGRGMVKHEISRINPTVEQSNRQPRVGKGKN